MNIINFNEYKNFSDYELGSLANELYDFLWDHDALGDFSPDFMNSILQTIKKYRSLTVKQRRGFLNTIGKLIALYNSYHYHYQCLDDIRRRAI